MYAVTGWCPHLQSRLSAIQRQAVLGDADPGLFCLRILYRPFCTRLITRRLTPFTRPLLLPTTFSLYPGARTCCLLRACWFLALPLSKDRCRVSLELCLRWLLQPTASTRPTLLAFFELARKIPNFRCLIMSRKEFFRNESHRSARGRTTSLSCSVSSYLSIASSNSRDMSRRDWGQGFKGRVAHPGARGSTT